MPLRGDSIRVLIVDDSPLVCKVLRRHLGAFPDIEVVATAPDPYVAREKIVMLQPDVITLDLSMPRMDGLTFLRKLMRYHPLPVVVLSATTRKGEQGAMDALHAGAVEVMCKPGGASQMDMFCEDLVQKIRSAAHAHIRRVVDQTRYPISRFPILSETRHKVIAIGASTGGVQTLEKILYQLPANLPGIVVVQHMPPHFTTSFAQRLDQICALQVHEAQDGDHVVPGQVLIAPGGAHMSLRRAGTVFRVAIHGGEPVCRQKPSVDVLFKSVAYHAGVHALGIILTGMGCDGAEGLLTMRQAGGRTLAQDEQSSIVFGMPKEAIVCGAVERVVPLKYIPDTMVQIVQDNPPHLKPAKALTPNRFDAHY